jgi:hypothetical protein
MTQRWVLRDPADSNPATQTYTFPINPDRMTSPFPARQVTYESTTAIDGQPIMWEAQTPPKQWGFGGTILNDTHYEALRHWTYDRQGRLWLWDHFGRRLTVTLTDFAPEPKRGVGRYWLHEYTVNAWVYAITAPTVGLGR